MQQHGVNDTEDGGGGADAEGEHDDDRGGETGKFRELAEREAEVGKHGEIFDFRFVNFDFQPPGTGLLRN
jgi:hypothetical protein